MVDRLWARWMRVSWLRVLRFSRRNAGARGRSTSPHPRTSRDQLYKVGRADGLLLAAGQYQNPVAGRVGADKQQIWVLIKQPDCQIRRRRGPIEYHRDRVKRRELFGCVGARGIHADRAYICTFLEVGADGGDDE